jgi:hypothetical protein
MPAARVASIQAVLAQRFPDAIPRSGWARGTISTGIAALDGILPDGGFQRGRIAVWLPAPGAAALLRSTCLRTVAGGERAVWIDATHTVTGAGWCEGPLLIRPDGPVAALRAAEELTRSGGFGLIVLDGVDPETTALVRVSRAAHEGGSALVLLTRTTSLASLRLASRSLPGAYVWRRSPLGEPAAVTAVKLVIEARASGWFASTELTIPVWHDDLRLSLETCYPDRRGAVNGREPPPVVPKASPSGSGPTPASTTPAGRSGPSRPPGPPDRCSPSRSVRGHR